MSAPSVYDIAVEVAAHVGDGMPERLAPGGSGAALYRLRTAGGQKVIKVVADRPEIVDGHEAEALVRKAHHARWVRSTSEALADLVVDVEHVVRGDGWAAIVMPQMSGIPLMDEIRTNPARGLQLLVELYDVLAAEGYAVRRSVASPNYAEVAHLRRILRRASWLDRCKRRFVWPVAINGRSCLPPEVAIRALLRDEEDIKPRWLHFPVHGDLNLRNVLLSDAPVRSRFCLLDLSGDTRDRDVLYDVAKSLFSLTLFEGYLREGIEVRHVSPGCVEIGPRWQGVGVALAFISALTDSELGRLVGGPRWTRRLLFTHAVHAVAEAACRQSASAATSTEADLGLGLYLSGTLLLNDLLVSPASPISTHLKLPWEGGLS